jgi:hypothetical protein
VNDSALILFDFGIPVVVDGATWNQSPNYTTSTWQWQGASDPTLSPNYLNPGGYGARTGSISTTTTLSISGSITYLVSGAYANSLYFNNQSVSGLYIRFDLGSAKIIDEAVWSQASSTNQGTWQWQGSNDASAWTSIGSTFTIASAQQVLTTLNGNTTGYRYYQMLGVSGSTSNADYEFSTMFRIMNGSSYSGTSAWTNIGSSFALSGTTQSLTTLSANTSHYRYYQMVGVSGTFGSGGYQYPIYFHSAF